MKAIRVLLIPALAALAFATVAEAQAQTNPMSRDSARSAGGAGIGSTSSETQRHSRGDRGGHWRGDNDGRWRGDHDGRWRGNWDGHRYRRHGHWHFGFAFGAPLLWPGYWGYPYYDPWFYPYPRTYVYREVERWPEIHPAEPPAESTQLPPPGTEGAPTQGPLYLNYCESARAYYPKVTACPEGWRLMTPTN